MLTMAISTCYLRKIPSAMADPSLKEKERRKEPSSRLYCLGKRKERGSPLGGKLWVALQKGWRPEVLLRAHLLLQVPSPAAQRGSMSSW